jgi:hypothetical protein
MRLSFDATFSVQFIHPRVFKGNLMNTIIKVMPLLTMALCATLAQAGPPATHGVPAPRDAINPQPLPPRHDRPQAMQARQAINPQPLPPERAGAGTSTSTGQQRQALSRPYIGETEKN